MTTSREEPSPYRPCAVLSMPASPSRASVELALEAAGWRVLKAEDGAAARRLARKVVPDLVILDVDLPRESGWLICSKMRMEPAMPAVVLVGREVTARDEKLARFVGALGVISAAGAGRCLPALLDAALSASLAV